MDGKDGKKGKKEARPMHLQTADLKMPFYKAKNWDIMAVTILGVILLLPTQEGLTYSATPQKCIVHNR